MKKIILLQLFTFSIYNCVAQNSVDNAKVAYDEGWYTKLDKSFSATFYDDFIFHPDYLNSTIPYPPKTPYLPDENIFFKLSREYISGENISSIFIEGNLLKIRFWEKGRTFIPLPYGKSMKNIKISAFDFDIITHIDRRSDSEYQGLVFGWLDNKNYCAITFSRFIKPFTMYYERYDDGISTFEDEVNSIYVEENSDNELRIKKENGKIKIYINSYEVYVIDNTKFAGNQFGFIALGALYKELPTQAVFKDIYINIQLPNETFGKPKEDKNIVSLKKINGVYSVPVELNGVLKIDFIFDSGASDISISPDVALTLLKTGTIKDDDWLPGAYYRFADGSSAKSMRFKLSSVKIGNKIIKNATCSISNSINAPMLLGQSVLSRFGKYTFDNVQKRLIIQ